jgi:hypothetical protein
MHGASCLRRGQCLSQSDIPGYRWDPEEPLPCNGLSVTIQSQYPAEQRVNARIRSGRLAAAPPGHYRIARELPLEGGRFSKPQLFSALTNIRLFYP